MKAFLDTSVLVSVFRGEHPHHAASLALFIQLGKERGCCGAHSLLELFSTITRMPGKSRITPDEAMLFLAEVRKRLSIIDLDAEAYWTAIEAAANLNITGAAIHDALLAECALKAGAEVIYTWNLKHFERCGPEVTRRVRTP